VPSDARILPERYADVELVGRGGMGEIYRATDRTLGRTVAVKLLAERYAADEEVRRRFTREALAAARLSGDPNVVTIFDVGDWSGRPFIVMEFLDGGSLDTILREQGLQRPERVLAWLDGAAQALDRAHADGIVHRDVKPANLLLDADGDVHVADFGIASAAGLDSFTRTGTVLGTAGYLSPEQARGERVSPASDRYALAVVAFELLTGARPFAATTPTAEALGHMRDPVPRISEQGPDLPYELDAVFARALDKDPGRRYPSCVEFVADIRDALDRAAGTTRVAAPAPPPPAAAAPLTRTQRYAPAGPPADDVGRRRRRLVPILVLLLAAAALGGVALAALVAGRDDGEAQQTAPQEVVRTITAPGATEQVTVTVPAPAPPPSPEPAPPPSPEPPPADERSGAELNDEGFALMQGGNYGDALPLLEQAVAKLAGSGQLVEAYALYNLAHTRLQLGNCADVRVMLDRSQAIQGRRSEIDRARAQEAEQCGDDD
jgi:eukaryotic-like serine/threonine-protein kinase